MNPDQLSKWTWQRTARHGAELGAVLSVAYSLLFDAYAIGTASVGSSADAVGANSVAIFRQTIPWMLAVLIPSALVGVLTALFIRALLARLNSSGNPGRGMLLGFGSTIVLTAVVTLVLVVTGMPLTLDVYPQTYLFWVGLPSLLYVAAGAVGARRLSAA